MQVVVAVAGFDRVVLRAATDEVVAVLAVETVFTGAALAAFLGAVIAFVLLGIRRREGSGALARGFGIEE